MSGELREWQIIDQYPSGIVIVGDVYNDERQRWEDGVTVLTSYVIAVRNYEDFYTVETLHRQYLLFKDKRSREYRTAREVGLKILRV